MKKLILLFSAIIICSCSGSDDLPMPTPTPTPTDDGKPVAVEDVDTTAEDVALIFNSLLSNDTVVDNAKITSFDATSANNGTIVDNRNGTYTYTPVKGFVGEDSFTYTLCDDDTPTNCSTATVTITVVDEGSPTATDDAVNVVENSALIITTLLNNDALVDDSTLTSVDNTNTIGTVTLNNDGSITYTPQSGFSGNDIFTYTICDDDTPSPTCSTATVTITVLEQLAFNIPAALSYYYSDLALSTTNELNYEQLKSHTIKNHTTILSYSQRHTYLYNADADETNSDNVILMYTSESRYWEEYTSGTNPYATQTFNTEHIYPQSLLSTDDAVTDLHHLRVCDANINSLRSNYPFTNGNGIYKLENNKWYPGDEWRGDVARMVMYLNIRYNETFEKVGGLDLFLEWNVADPVSSFEIQRNAEIESAQGVRNPFIDNPYLATLIWGGTAAENKW